MSDYMKPRIRAWDRNFNLLWDSETGGEPTLPIWWQGMDYAPSGLDEFHPDTTHNPRNANE